MTTLKCFTILPFYYIAYFFKYSKLEDQSKFDWYISILTAVVIFLVTAWLFSLGYGDLVLYLWIYPAVFATFFLALSFDLLPHYPHKETSAYKNSYIFLNPIAGILLIGQNYHLIHHLYPKIPFYNYGLAFKSLEEMLKERGAPIFDARFKRVKD